MISKAWYSNSISVAEHVVMMILVSAAHFFKPSAPETLPRSSPGLKSIFCGVGAVCPLG